MVDYVGKYIKHYVILKLIFKSNYAVYKAKNTFTLEFVASK